MKRETTREGFAYAEKSVNASPVRYHYMDNLRALAMLAGGAQSVCLLGGLAGQRWLAEANGLALVMTSANISGDPLVIERGEAECRLADIAENT